MPEALNVLCNGAATGFTVIAQTVLLFLLLCVILAAWQCWGRNVQVRFCFATRFLLGAGGPPQRWGWPIMHMLPLAHSVLIVIKDGASCFSLAIVLLLL